MYVCSSCSGGELHFLYMLIAVLITYELACIQSFAALNEWWLYCQRDSISSVARIWGWYQEPDVYPTMVNVGCTVN